MPLHSIQNTKPITMKIVNYLAFILFVAGTACLSGCDKSEQYDIITPPPQSHFLATGSTYYITNDPNTVFKIPVGTSNVSQTNRTINVSVSSPTGAASGSQYTLASSNVTIPAGKAVDTLSVKGLFAGYTSTRVDTLVFTLSGGDLPAGSSNIYRLVLRKACDVVGANLVGNYTRSTDTYNGAPSTSPNYTAVISNFTPVNATSATVIIKNLGATSDNGWGPFAATDPVIATGITATLNYADPGKLTVTIANQNYFGTTSSMSTITGTGTFSACDNTFAITCNVRYAVNGNTYTHVSLLNK